MKEFIVNYWQYISVGLVVIFEILILILKRLKLKINLPSNSLKQLIEFVNDAEKIYGSGHGKEKLNYVVQKYIKSNDIKFFDYEVEYYVSRLVEEILSTPQKKNMKEGD